MSAQEQHGAEAFEPTRSKVKLVRNAKGDPQWEISVVVGEEDSEVERIRRVAVSQYRALEEEFRIAKASD